MILILWFSIPINYSGQIKKSDQIRPTFCKAYNIMCITLSCNRNIWHNIIRHKATKPPCNSPEFRVWGLGLYVEALPCFWSTLPCFWSPFGPPYHLCEVVWSCKQHYTGDYDTRSFSLSTCQHSRVGHSYMYLRTHMRRKGIYHGAIYVINWNFLHLISTNKSNFCHFDDPIRIYKAASELVSSTQCSL